MKWPLVSLEGWPPAEFNNKYPPTAALTHSPLPCLCTAYMLLELRNYASKNLIRSWSVQFRSQIWGCSSHFHSLLRVSVREVCLCVWVWDYWEFASVMAWGETLLQKLAVVHRILQNVLPEANKENIPLWGWAGSLVYSLVTLWRKVFLIFSNVPTALTDVRVFPSHLMQRVQMLFRIILALKDQTSLSDICTPGDSGILNLSKAVSLM